MERYRHLFKKSPKLVIGLMSGTSLDGIDAALVQVSNQGINTQLNLVQFLTVSYPAGLKERLVECSTPGHGSVDEICRLNVLLGEIFAEAALNVVAEAGLEPESVDLIGSHGQTVHHLPEWCSAFGYRFRSTLQLGEPSVIAQRTGILTVADFRHADMASGGEGAPLVPYFDYVIFRDPNKSRGLLNIGGIANITILRKNCDLDEVLAFDTGPGNMLLDSLMQELFGEEYDDAGRTARSGRPSPALLEIALGHPYFERPPPKSTGREFFGMTYRDEFLSAAAKLGLPPEDVVRSATELTTRSIWDSYRRFVAPELEIDELIVSGGGASNSAILSSLATMFDSIPVKSVEEFGIPGDAKEAICFAVLANETVCGIPSNVPSATGALRPTILGKLCF